MRVLVYGSGAVGCYIGGHLALAGHTVVLLGREPLVDAVQSSGLVLNLAAGPQHIRAIRATPSLDEALAGGESYDWIAFTMKAYDTVPAIFELQTRLPEPPPVISFQNGIGNEESLRAAFGAERVVAGTMTTPVSMPEPGVVIQEKQRGLAIAADSPAAARIWETFANTALSVEMVDSTPSLKWSKLLLNMLCNATSAILDMAPGEVFQNPAMFALERAALLEALAIMELKNIRVVNLPGAPARLLANLMRRVPPVLARPLLQTQIAGGRGEKLPSLLAALRAGSRRTEVAWLNGAVALAADQIKRLAPINHALALTVSDIAAGRAPWEMYRHKPDMLLTVIRATSRPG